jgi:hypothetical protein
MFFHIVTDFRTILKRLRQKSRPETVQVNAKFAKPPPNAGKNG